MCACVGAVFLYIWAVGAVYGGEDMDGRNTDGWCPYLPVWIAISRVYLCVLFSSYSYTNVLLIACV